MSLKLRFVVVFLVVIEWDQTLAFALRYDDGSQILSRRRREKAFRIRGHQRWAFVFPTHINWCDASVNSHFADEAREIKALVIVIVLVVLIAVVGRGKGLYAEVVGV